MKISTIEIAGRKYPLCLSLTATVDISERFGGLEEMSKEITSGDVTQKCKAIADVLEILAHAGRIYCEGIGEEVPPPLKCKISDAIGITDADTLNAIFGVIAGDSAQTVTAKDPKNAVPTQEEH